VALIGETCTIVGI